MMFLINTITIGINKQKREHMYIVQYSASRNKLEKYVISSENNGTTGTTVCHFRLYTDAKPTFCSSIGFLHLVESTFCCVNVWLCRPIESTFGGLTYSIVDSMFCGSSSWNIDGRWVDILRKHHFFPVRN